MAKEVARRTTGGMRGLEADRDVLGLRDTINGLFEDFFSGRPVFATFPLRGEGVMNWVPAVDIKETNDEVIVRAGLPGVPKDKCNIEVRDNSLILSGEIGEKGGEANFIRAELPSGQFYRAFNLPADVKSDQVKANYRDGILEIHMPKTEQAKPHKVPIQ